MDSYSDTRRREPGVEGGRAAVVWLLLTRTRPATSLRSGGGADAYDALACRRPSGVAAAWAGSWGLELGLGRVAWVGRGTRLGCTRPRTTAHSPQRGFFERQPSERVFFFERQPSER